MYNDSRLVHQTPPTDNGREWLTGLVVVVAIIVSFIGFARVSVAWTLAIATVIFVALILFLWIAGGKKRP